VTVVLNSVTENLCSAKGGELLVQLSGCWVPKACSVDFAIYPMSLKYIGTRAYGEMFY
jgi:hypothetical protein